MGTDATIDIAARISGATTDFAGRMTGAIRDAARQTGAGFDYLLNTALRESNLNPNAKAKTSSATGLFQFIDQTWLGTLKQSGASLGYGKYANAITRTSQGRFVVNDPAMKQEIFALRKDPTANAVMAGAFANSNAKVLTDRLGRKPSDGELYIAHFLGASGAARFISAAEARPDTKAASLFPKAAAANQGIFYDRQGGAKSVKQVYAGLISKHDVIGSTRLAAAKPAQSAEAVDGAKTVQTAKAVSETAAAAVQKLAALPVAFFRDLPAVKTVAPATPSVAASATSSTNAAPASRIADAHAAVATTDSAPTTVAPPAKAVTPVAGTAAPAEAASATASETLTFAPEPVAQSKTYPMFQSLFHENGRGAVAPVVRELWGARGLASTETPTAGAPAADASAPGAARVKGPLDLMRFGRPTTRRPT